MSYVYYADQESLIKKLLTCKNNPEKSFMPKPGKNIAFGYSISTMCGFGDRKYKGKDSMQTI